LSNGLLEVNLHAWLVSDYIGMKLMKVTNPTHFLFGKKEKEKAIMQATND